MEQQIKTLCEQHNVKVTNARSSILEVLKNAGAPMNYEQIKEKLLHTFSEEKRKVLVYGQHISRDERKALGKYATTRKGNFRQFLTPMIEEKWLNLETGEIVWERDQSLETINKVLECKQINIVKKTEEQKGEFSKQERLKKGKASVAFKE